MTVYVNELRLAEDFGTKQALSRIKQGFVEAEDDIWERISRTDTLFLITNEKIDPDSEDGWILIDTIESAYYNTYDNYDEEETNDDDDDVLDFLDEELESF